MRATAVVAVALVAACKFEPGSYSAPVEDAPEGAVDASLDTTLIDAPPADARMCPAAPATCTAFTCAGSSSCYYICGTSTTGKQSYAGARGSCTNSEIGCIVTIDDQAENDCIAAATLPTFPSALVWLGYEQSPSGSEPDGGWSWRCGTSSYLAPNWGDFEPNNEGGGEDCTLMSAGGAWIDGDCGGSARFVCELP